MIRRLLTVKSIVTILLTCVFAYLSIIRVVSADQFHTVFTVIIGFYFGTQKVKEYENTDDFTDRTDAHNGR